MNINRRLLYPIIGLILLSTSPGCLAQDPPQRSFTQLSDNVYRAQDNIHFTVVVVTPDGIMMTDPINRDFSLWLKDELNKRFNLPVKYVLYSHDHWDHASGGSVFADTAVYVGQENMLVGLAMPPADTPLSGEAAELDANGNGKLEVAEAIGSFQNYFALFDANADGVLSGAEVQRGRVSDVKAPDMTFREKLTVSLGGSRAELTWTGLITHADDMSVIRFLDEGVIYVVDFISVKTMPYRTMMEQHHLNNWLQSIRDVMAMDFDIVAAGHGPVGTKSDIADHLQYLETLHDAVLTGMKAGHGVAELQESIQLDQYSDWFMFGPWHSENVQGMYQLILNQD